MLCDNLAMQAGAGFEVGSEPLRALLEQLHDGRIQVPEFQRPVVLKDEWVKSLLASVSLGYPVGAVMLLATDDHYARFATHAVQGAPSSEDVKPDRLLVDGQHRMAALYQALHSGGGVPVQDGDGRMSKRSYFINMRIAMNPVSDRDEAIFSVGEGTGSQPIQRRDFLFPVGLVYGGKADRDRCLADFAQKDESRAALAGQFEAGVLSAFEEYMVPVILFPKEWTRWTVRMRGGANGRALSDELGIPGRAEVG